MALSVSPRVLTFVTAALLAPLASGCVAPMKLDLTSPEAASADAFRDDVLAASFRTVEGRLEVTVSNRGAAPLYLHWERAQMTDGKGGAHDVVTFRTPGVELLAQPGPGAEVAPRASWTGYVHPRDYLRKRSRTQVSVQSLFHGAEPGQTFQLVLPVDVGSTPKVYEFGFTARVAEGG
jgi:hypothetical protein